MAMTWRARSEAVPPAPVVVHRHGDLTVIEVRYDFGPATEPRVGRLLNHAIREDAAARVLLDLRRLNVLGEGCRGLIRLAQLLAAERGVRFEVMR